jgi:hypothetical protein
VAGVDNVGPRVWVEQFYGQESRRDDCRAQLVVCAEVQNVLAIENFGAVDIEKVHDRPAVRIVFETEHVTEFVYGGGI